MVDGDDGGRGGRRGSTVWIYGEEPEAEERQRRTETSRIMADEEKGRGACGKGAGKDRVCSISH
jgi:hypothetical protein